MASFAMGFGYSAFWLGIFIPVMIVKKAFYSGIAPSSMD